MIRETLEEGVDLEVISTVRSAVSHLEELGCIVTEVTFCHFFLSIFSCDSVELIEWRGSLLPSLSLCNSGVIAVIFPWITSILYPCFM